MEEIRIREAILDDAENLATLMTVLGYPTSTGEMARRFERISAAPSRVTLVAERDGMVAGMIGVGMEHAYEVNDAFARVTAFVVAPEHRGRGIGCLLAKAAEEWATERDASDIVLNTNKRRTGAHRFYRRMGHEETGYRFHKVLDDPDK